MNEQLQQALTALLGRATTGVDFLVAELPEVVQQLLVWKAAEATLGMCVALVVGAFAGTLIARFLRGPKEGERPQGVMRFVYDCDGDLYEGVCFVGPVVAAAFIGATVAAYQGGSTALQIWIAPKVYLIEYAASLAK